MLQAEVIGGLKVSTYKMQDQEIKVIDASRFISSNVRRTGQLRFTDGAV